MRKRRMRECPVHPDLVLHADGVQHELIVACTHCDKELRLPLTSAHTLSEAELAQCIGATFGHEWEQHYARVMRRWTREQREQ